MANFTRKTLTLAAGLMLSVMSSNAQQLREGYIDAGKDTGSEKFQFALQNWQNNHRLSKDDNFYISRVKPMFVSVTPLLRYATLLLRTTRSLSLGFQ